MIRFLDPTNVSGLLDNKYKKVPCEVVYKRLKTDIQGEYSGIIILESLCFSLLCQVSNR